MIVTNEEWNALKKERDERQALLERVFGKRCDDCCCSHLNQTVDGIVVTHCDFFCLPIVSARPDDCPFLPFEVKK